MITLSAETCRLAVANDLCSRWMVLNAAWNGHIEYDIHSPWGRILKELTEIPPDSEAVPCIAIENAICWTVWRLKVDPYPMNRTW